MKFCKNLQRMIRLFDPSWSPYWINYKMLKKIIKALPLLETEYDTLLQCRQAFSVVFGEQFTAGEKTSEKKATAGDGDSGLATYEQPENDLFASLAMSPREVAFFKLLHAELRKAVRFFERIEQELMIREERIRHGIRIVRDRPVSMIAHRWLVVARSVHLLYRDLLTLETYAVMSYCSFSKILKKHDKVTGYPTRMAYMTNFVEKANFSSYPRLLAMFHRCRRMDEEISVHVLQELTADLTDDERLFVRAVRQLSDRAVQTTAERGTPPFAASARKQMWKPAVDAAAAAARVRLSSSGGTKENDDRASDPSSSAAVGKKREQQQRDDDEEEEADRKMPAVHLSSKKRKR